MLRKFQIFALKISPNDTNLVEKSNYSLFSLLICNFHEIFEEKFRGLHEVPKNSKGVTLSPAENAFYKLKTSKKLTLAKIRKEK